MSKKTLGQSSYGQIAGPLISMGSKMAGGIVDSAESGNTAGIFSSIGGAMPGIGSMMGKMGS